MSQKFCGACGNPLSENEKFCGKCGAPAPKDEPAAETAPEAAPAPETVSAPIPEPAAAPVPEEVSNNAFTAPVPPVVEASPVPAAAAVKSGGLGKYKVPIIAGAVAVVAIIVAIVVLLSIPKYQKIDAKELFHVSFKGVNGQGTAVAYLNCSDAALTMDYDRYRMIARAEDSDEEIDDEGYSKYFTDDKKELLKAYDKAKDKSEAQDMKKALLKMRKEEYVLKLKLDKDSELSNGDTIKCTVDFDEEDLKEAKIELENTEFEIEVEGLLEGEKIDIFDGFNISFEGQDEDGKAVFDDRNSKFDFIRYYASTSNYDLKNGDTFVVEASFYTSQLEDVTYLDPNDYSKGVAFKYKDKVYIAEKTTDTKSFTVSGLKEAEGIDVFKDIKFTTRGAAPYLKISSVDKNDCEDVIKDNLYFSLEGTNDLLKSGDTFKVKVNPYSLKREGYKATGYDDIDDDGYVYKTYTIDESFGYYITDKSTSEDVDKLKDQFDTFLQKFENQYKGRSSMGGESFEGKIESFAYEFYKDYVILPEGFAEGELGSSDAKNILFRVYKVTATDDTGASKSALVAFRFTGAYINAKGEGALDSSVASLTVAADEEALKEFFEKDSEKGTAVALNKGNGGSNGGNDSSEPDDESSEGEDETSMVSNDSSEEDTSKDE